ncbi:MAG: hypothetical protein ACLPN5_04105 [Roseiarcus sp.]
MVNPLDLQAALQYAWQSHPRFKHRALGGRRALDGFHYQFAVSLDRFFEAVLEGNDRHATVAFEGLSDLSELRGNLFYLIQVKTTLRPDALKSALAEALAVDEFLEESFPQLRAAFRFRITTRRLQGNVPTEPATLTAADLALDSTAAQRWDALRNRCLPVEVESAPEVRLAIRLWRDVIRPIALIDSCMGRLLDMIASNALPDDITKSLMSLWQIARREKPAPLHLLSVADLTTNRSTNHERRIIHGVRPTILDIRDGCFMDRPARLEAALSVIREHWAEQATERRPSFPVFWICGPSGAGKSVLVLQVAGKLLAEGQVEAVNFVEAYAHALPRALDNAVGASIPMIVAGDDLYSPDNRDQASWREIGELSASRRFPARFAILTCGPLEHLKAFKRDCERYQAFQTVEIKIEALDLEERVAYHAWYQERTGAEVPLSREEIFVAAAWIYELHREQRLTPEAFATRFDGRLRELDIARAGRAALALNLYGLKAPEALFANRRAELAQLVGERIWRLASPSAGTLTGRFFHPQISRLIYDALVPRAELVRRAEDMARGFDAMLEEEEPADAFLAWLGSKKIGKNRGHGALMLDEAMRVEILRALWPCFRERGAVHEVVPRLLRWHHTAREAGINLEASGAKGRIQSWWRATEEDAPSWGLLFQMVWDTAEPERTALVERGRTWLETHMDTGSWPWVYQRLLEYTAADSRLRALGLQWLEVNPAGPNWPRVWGTLFETLKRSVWTQDEIEELRRLVLVAIPIQPESEADLAVWERTAKLDPPELSLLNAVMRKLAIVRSPYKVDKGVDFLLRFIAPGELVIKLSPGLQDTVSGRAWPHVWTNISQKRPDEPGLPALGREWLKGREDQPEWTHVWRKLIDRNFECDTLLPRGREWLKGREDQPEWNFVWQKLIDRNFECDTLLPRGREWLKGREKQPGWQLVANKFRTRI